MKIRVVTPIVTKEFVTPEAAEEYAAAVGLEHEVSVVAIDKGPASIESEYDEALAAPDVIARITLSFASRLPEGKKYGHHNKILVIIIEKS